jgi:haloacetate dehalogenase
MSSTEVRSDLSVGSSAGRPHAEPAPRSGTRGGPARLLPDTFTNRRVVAGDVEINCAVGGEGPPVLLLHGYPETHVMWHLIAPALADEHTVVLADLRGYGDSDKPAPSPDAAEYSKRAMAADQLALMRALGYEQFALVGHDRGARVGLRLAYDAPEAVTHFAALDIVPTRHVYGHVDRRMAIAYYHWFFLIQRNGIPERLLAAEPEAWVRSVTEGLATTALDPRAIAEYVRCFTDPATVWATCADYRAGAGIDLELDEETARRGQRLECPTLVLWGEQSFVNTYDVPAVWSEYAVEPQTVRVGAGHFLPEEAPAEVLERLAPFLRGAGHPGLDRESAILG